MQEVSLKKRRFLESIGIDINHLPAEFERYSTTIESTFSKEEIDFLKRENLTGRYLKTFCLKDLVGTIHPDYTDKTWIETFLLSKRGDRTVEEYCANPEYYWVGLKQQNQSNLRHDSPIELLESNGKFFINGGNNRLSLIMMIYLAEISKAQTEEEKRKIDEKYIFMAEVQPTPKDNDIMYIINMIREAYGKRAIIKRTANNEEDCKYIIQLEEQTISINNKEELKQVLKDSYRVEKVENLEELQYNIINLLQDKIIYEARTDQNRAKILNGIFPNLEKFQTSFVKLKRFHIEDKLYEGIDLKNLKFSELSNKAIEMSQREELRIREEQEIAERRKKELEEERKRKRAENRKEVSFTLKMEHVHQQIKNIIEYLEKTYYELKQEEMKFSKLANKLTLNCSIIAIDDTNIHLSIEQLKRNIQKLVEQIQEIDNIEELQKISGVLQELENLIQEEKIKNNYSMELKEEFARSFDNKVQELIINSRISKLKEQKEEVENEKVTFIGRIVGKEKLKQAKLDNINLKMQLLMLDNKKNKISYSLEETLSDLYTYSQCENKNKLTTEVNQFLEIVKEDLELKEIIEQEQLNSKVHEKVNSIQSEIQLIPTNDNGRISNRYQANILELQNNDINRQIQNNRARAIIKQNDLLNSSINSNSSLNKFQNIISQINLKVQLKDTRIVEKEEQEKQLQY